MSKNFNETVRLQSEIRREWIQEVRGKNYKGLQRAQVAHPVWPAHQPRRSPEKRMSGDPLQSDRTEGERRQFLPDLPQSLRYEERWRRGQNESQIVGEEKWQTLWCCRDQQRACRMAQASAEKLEHTGPAEKERVASVPQKEQLARTP